MKKLRELYEERAKLVKEGRDILNKADEEKRDLTQGERDRYDAIDKELDGLKERIDREEKQSRRESTIEKEVKEVEDKGYRSAGEKEKDGTPEEREQRTQRAAVQKYLLGAMDALDADERRALSQLSAPDGGFLVPTQEVINTLLKKVDDLVFIRGLATKFTLEKAVSLGVPSLDTDPDDADWTTELGTGNEDTAMKFGKRELFPNPFAKRVKISNQLMRNSAIPVDTLVLDRLAYKFGITEEKGYLTGNGAKRPLGLFTASPAGISTARDVATENTSSAPTWEGLINAKYALKGQYWNRCAWIFHRDCLKILRKIKNSHGDFIWEPSVRAGEPDTILDRPVYMSEFCPNTFTTGLYVGILGDFTLYWIADTLQFSVQRLQELYAETNQTGFIGRKESDGMPALEEGFVRVKLG